MRNISDKERKKRSAEITGLESQDLNQLRAQWKHLYEIKAPPHLSRDDIWVLGASANYDGFSGTRPGMPPALRRDPFGVIGSINYVEGPWVLGGYY